MEIKNVAVIGAGTMGNGIAHVFAVSDYEVFLIDIKQDYAYDNLEAFYTLISIWYNETDATASLDLS